MADLKREIQNLIAAADLEGALSYAKQVALDGVTDLDTPVVLLQSEFEHARRQNLKGLLSLKDLFDKHQEITAKLLNLLDVVQWPSAHLTAPANREVILFLSANPFQSLVLKLEREMNLISDGLVYFGQRQKFDFRGRMHVSPADLQRMLLEAGGKPRFVHFAGNAAVNHQVYGSGLIFEDENGQPATISGNTLAAVFKQFKSVECVVLNTCDSGPAALELGQTVPYVIGMNAAIYDEAAIQFAVAFYEAIASGNTITFAFEFACTRLMLSPWPDQAGIPVLIHNGQPSGTVYQTNPGFGWDSPGRPMR